MLRGSVVPLYLQRPDRWFWRESLDDGTLYVHLGRIRDQGEERLGEALDRLVEEAGDRRPRFAIVDLRGSPGGNYELTAPFARQLPSIIPEVGHIFILVGPATFSAAIVTAARLKYFAGDRGVLLGQPMGDRATFWGEGDDTTLPNSGLEVRYATAVHDWRHGCGLADLFRCFWLHHCLGVAAGNLEPVPVPLRFSDYVVGRDLAMEQVRRRIRATTDVVE